mmetsp:Transcript_39134/g.118211  ORF Transcript_39134/g.118211 Transcript_39134/m.118211 type:complete len:257 (-) Transcript_39134:117-887(-)
MRQRPRRHVLGAQVPRRQEDRLLHAGVTSDGKLDVHGLLQLEPEVGRVRPQVRGQAPPELQVHTVGVVLAAPVPAESPLQPPRRRPPPVDVRCVRRDVRMRPDHHPIVHLLVFALDRDPRWPIPVLDAVFLQLLPSSEPSSTGNCVLEILVPCQELPQLHALEQFLGNRFWRSLCLLLVGVDDDSGDFRGDCCAGRHGRLGGRTLRVSGVSAPFGVLRGQLVMRALRKRHALLVRHNREQLHGVHGCDSPRVVHEH